MIQSILSPSDIRERERPCEVPSSSHILGFYIYEMKNLPRSESSGDASVNTIDRESSKGHRPPTHFSIHHCNIVFLRGEGGDAILTQF